jgi:hypothetical protein
MNKRDQKIAAKKSGHHVLLFGEDVFGDDPSKIRTHENADIDPVRMQDYGKLKRLTDYTLVILDYAPFNLSHGVDADKQDVFEKMMMEALDQGTSFCFVHYNEKVPKYDPYGSSNVGKMDEKDIAICQDNQLGFRFFNRFSIRPLQVDQPIVSAETNRSIFRPFLVKWGASHNCFSTYGQYEFDDIICQVGDYPMAFSSNAKAGRIMMMPFQRDFDRHDDLQNAIYTLIDCLLTYITKSLTELPDWATQPFFEKERTLYAECQELKARLNERSKAFEPFIVAKELLCQAEYTLEHTVPEFLTQHIRLQAERNEQFKEDFWILNSSGDKVILGEVKSYVKGFKKSGIFSLYNHRETNKLPQEFPALLVVNAHMQAASWEEKDRPIDKQDYEIAAQNNILVVRIEDLVRVWDAVRAGRFTPEDILSALTKMTGWLEVRPDGKMIEHK